MPNDNFDLEKSHVLPALIRKIHLAKLLSESNFEAVMKDLNVDTIEEAENYLASFGVSANSVEIWGTGKPRREFLHVDDAAMACYYLMQRYESAEIVNIGSGEDHTIKEMAIMIKKITGFNGNLIFDESKPDGTMRKLLDVSKLNSLGWKSTIELEDGLIRTYDNFQKNYLYYINHKDRRFFEIAHI